jgi:hypothetical protein
MDNTESPRLQPAAEPGRFDVGDRVRLEGEVRWLGEESHLVRIESGRGLLQYVWVRLRDIFKA